MKLTFSAGNFSVETWTEGHPTWIEVSYRGKAIEERFHHNELKDLIYILERMRVQARASMPEQYRYEFD